MASSPQPSPPAEEREEPCTAKRAALQSVYCDRERNWRNGSGTSEGGFDAGHKLQQLTRTVIAPFLRCFLPLTMPFHNALPAQNKIHPSFGPFSRFLSHE
jgi:hypothetical protein